LIFVGTKWRAISLVFLGHDPVTEISPLEVFSLVLVATINQKLFAQAIITQLGVTKRMAL